MVTQTCESDQKKCLREKRVKPKMKLAFPWTFLKAIRTRKLNYSILLMYKCCSDYLEMKNLKQVLKVQFSSVTQSGPTLYDPMNHSTPGLSIHHQLPESTQTHVHWVDDAIQLSYPLSSPSPPALNLSQHQGLYQWVSSSHQVAKVLEFQLQHQSFQ